MRRADGVGCPAAASLVALLPPGLDDVLDQGTAKSAGTTVRARLPAMPLAQTGSRCEQVSPTLQGRAPG